MTDAELIAVAREAESKRGHPMLTDAEVCKRGRAAEVLLSDPKHARGGGLLVVIDTATGAVLRVIPQR